MSTDTTWLENEAHVQYLTPQLDQLCDRFEAAWKAALAGAGPRPHVEDYLTQTPEQERKVLLRELMELEFPYRKKHEERSGRGSRRSPGSGFPTPFPWETVQVKTSEVFETSEVLAKTGGEDRPAKTLASIRCLHCHQPIELADNRPEEVSCPACGGSFRVCDVQEAKVLPQPLGKFQLLERVGVGAYGTVWKARDSELHRLVALKIPHPVLANYPHELERFHREARAAAQLRHPGIVTVHEVTMLEGLPTIVSDFIDGVTLRDLVKERKLTFRESAGLVAEVAGALDYAHSMGLVHRDIKPANIMVRIGDTGSGGEVRGKEDSTTHYSPLSTHQPMIMDFGLALRDEAEITMTVDGHVVGTPAYMSPEQAAGKGHRADRRSDVYSLGVILYELLSGELPFKGSKKFIMEQVQEQEPRPPRQINDKIPRDLQTICLKAMAKSSARRYPTARELADDLRSFLKGEPIKARPIGRTEKFLRLCWRNPGWTTAGTVAAAGFAAGIYLLALFGIHKSTAATTLAKEQTKTKGALATLAFERGWNLCQQGQIEQGLLWLARSLQNTADDDQQRAVRAGLAVWGHKLRIPKASFLHEGPVYAVAFSPDGKTVLTGSKDQTARFWDVMTGKPIGPSLRHPHIVSAVAFSPDGKTVLTGGGDNTARLWQVATGKAITLRHEGPVTGVAFSPDGKRVVTGSKDKTARLWDATTGQPIGEPLRHSGEVYSVAFSPDGKTVLTGSAGPSDRGFGLLWDVSTSKTIDPPLIHPAPVRAVAFSPDGKRILTGCDDKNARLWQPGTGELPTTFSLHQSVVSAVAFSPSGELILTGSMDKTAQLWDTSGKPIGPPFRHQGEVTAVAFSPDGQTILTGSVSDRMARLWDARARMASRHVLSHKFPGQVRAVAFSPDGKTAVTASFDNTARLWDTATGKSIGLPLQHTGHVLTVAFSPDGKTVLTGSADNSACLWDAKTGIRLHQLKGHEDWVWAVAYSPDGKTAVTGSSDGTPRVWDTASGKELFQLHGHQDAVQAVAFSPDGKTILTGSFDMTACLWEAGTGRLIRHLQGHLGPIRAVAFSPDGKTILTGSLDRTARLWEAATGNPMALLPHLARVWAVAFSPDAKTVLTGSDDNTAQLWDASTGQPIGPALRHKDAVRTVAFSPDGKTLLTGSEDTTAQLWDAKTGQPIGPPLPHRGSVFAAAFSPDGKTMLTGSNDSAARLWGMPTLLEGDAKSIVLWTQIVTGMELDSKELIRELTVLERQERRQQLEELGGPQLP